MKKFLTNLKRRKYCPHVLLDSIHGDEANHTGGKRLICRDCGALLDGPVELVGLRMDEHEVYLDWYETMKG